MSMKSGLQVLSFAGGGSLLIAHLRTAAAFRRRTDAMFARLEHASVAELSTPSVPAIIQSFARRAIRETPVPNTVWLRQCGEMRANLRGSGKPFAAEQVISIHQPGFASPGCRRRLSHRRAFLTATWIARVFSMRASSALCPWHAPRVHRRTRAN